MRRGHLIIAAPLLGAGLVMASFAASQASSIERGDAGMTTSSRAAAVQVRIPMSDYTRGYRSGYRDGFADGRDACRRREMRPQGPRGAYARGYVAGYDRGFTAGCRYSRH